MSALCLELHVRVCKIALPGRNYPPAAESPSRYQNILSVPKRPPAPFGEACRRRIKALWRVEISLEGVIVSGGWKWRRCA